MGLVNADSNTVLAAWQNITRAVSSIEATKASVTRKYQQLGTDWNDKKYRELGDVIQECSKSLNAILKILLQAEKPLATLAKSLQDYEETELSNTDPEHNHLSSVNSFQTSVLMKKNATEKLRDFKKGLAVIDGVIANYTESLESRGLQHGPVMDAILNQQRHLLQAELLRNINGEFSNPVPTLTASDFDLIMANCQNRSWLNFTAQGSSPRSLAATRYGFTTQTINGTEMRVYDDPIGTNSLLIQQQGTSRYNMEGTCGLCQSSNLLTMAGVQGSSEDAIISAAMHSSDDILDCMELFNSATEERGGTTAKGRQEILSNCGLPTYCLPVRFIRSRTIRKLSRAIRTGHGVIVSVDVAYLWRNGQRGGHAISLISVSEDGNTFIYNDTGSGRMGTISSHDLRRALTGRPANVTTNIIR